jgi:hypothetical protein
LSDRRRLGCDNESAAFGDDLAHPFQSWSVDVPREGKSIQLPGRRGKVLQFTGRQTPRLQAALVAGPTPGREHVAALRTDFSPSRGLLLGRRSFAAEHSSHDRRDSQPDAVADDREHAQAKKDKEDFHRSAPIPQIRFRLPRRVRASEIYEDNECLPPQRNRRL